MLTPSSLACSNESGAGSSSQFRSLTQQRWRSRLPVACSLRAGRGLSLVTSRIYLRKVRGLYLDGHYKSRWPAEKHAENLSGKIRLDSWAFLLTTKLFERANQIVACRITPGRGGMLIGDNWSHLEVRTWSVPTAFKPCWCVQKPKKCALSYQTDFRRLFLAGHKTSAG